MAALLVFFPPHFSSVFSLFKEKFYIFSHFKSTWCHLVSPVSYSHSQNSLIYGHEIWSKQSEALECLNHKSMGPELNIDFFFLGSHFNIIGNPLLPNPFPHLKTLPVLKANWLDGSGISPFSEDPSAPCPSLPTLDRRAGRGWPTFFCRWITNEFWLHLQSRHKAAS